ncbi:hypothetical protein N3K66_001771 [Trichothecium roseum]|uniref:Uncharacterized protein n=1 Tax=Trichothecium roseum TaxID=47278 RepID=A0ACC0V810_9HYPO|nr:hypothetical protein N3K66_001771 [Trichothecium roseum]
MSLSPSASRRGHGHSHGEPGEADEQTPLLIGGGTAIVPPSHDAEPNPKLPSPSPSPAQDGRQKPLTTAAESHASPPPSLPKIQILVLCYARMMEPIAFFSIFPFIAQMVQRNGSLPASDVGFYSGLIESLFSATQMVVLILWGRLADRVGRKPVLLASLAGMAAGPALFGLATSLWQMILFRCLAGVFSGSSLVIRTMISEHSTPGTQARAFSWFAFGGNLGIFLGPIVGGALADPVQQYPRFFAGNRFLERYPYALPGFVVGAICATGVVVTALFLEETLPDQKKTSSSSSQTSQDATPAAPKEMSIWDLVRSPGVALVLALYSHVMLLAFAFTAIVPVALYTPVALGGLGLSSLLISAYMAAQGASQALWLLAAFPWLQRRLGTRGVLRACGLAYPFFFAGYPLLNALLRQGTEPARTCFWVLGALVALVGPGVSMAFTGVQLSLNDVSPSPKVLGTLNAIALTASSGIRSVAPGVSTAIYAVGVRNHILWGHLAWILLIPLAAAVPFFVKLLPEDKKPQQEPVDEEQ